MDDGGNKSEFELEVNDKDVKVVSMDIDSAGDVDADLPTDGADVVEGDLPAPDEDPGDKPAEPEKSAEESSEEDELDSELEALEAEEKAEEAAEAEEVAIEAAEDTEEKVEASEETTVADEAKPEEAPAEDAPEADEKPAEEEKPTEEEEKPVEEEKPAEEVAEEEPPIVVEGVNAPVDSTQANSTFPVAPAEEKKKSSKTGIFVLIAIIILLLIGCGIFFAFGGGLGGGSNNNNNNNQGGNNGKETKSNEVLARELDVKLLKDWVDGKENVVYSPLSIKYALAMLEDATNSSTKQEVVDLIGKDYEPRKYTSNKNMTIANAIFVRDDFKELMKSTYLDTIKQKYNANAIYDPFNNAATVNDWVYKNTLSLIPRIFDDEDIQAMDFVLINATAIDMEWINTFQCAFGEDGTRHGDCLSYYVSYAHMNYGDHVGSYDSKYPSKVEFDGKGKVNSLELGATINNYDIIKELGEDYIRSTVKAAYDKWKESAPDNELKSMEDAGYGDFESYYGPYLEAIKKPYGDLKFSTDFRMYNDANFKVFAKDLREYEGTQLEYVAIMPKSTSLKEYVSDVTVDKIDELIGKLKEIKNENFADKKVTKITGNIPIFKYKVNYDLKEELEKLGVKTAFTEKADLSLMTSSDDARLTDARHAATIDFSNEGIKAAAVTTLGGMGDGGLPFDYVWDLPVEEIDMTFDKPYMYLIRDKANGEVWFMGAVYEPTAA